MPPGLHCRSTNWMIQAVLAPSVTDRVEAAHLTNSPQTFLAPRATSNSSGTTTMSQTQCTVFPTDVESHEKNVFFLSWQLWR